MKQILLSVALIIAPVALFSGVHMVTASTAAVTTGLGDLSSLKTIVADVQAKVAAGDMQGAAARVTDWETAWDHGQTAIRPLNPTYWGNIDAASDAALSSVRAKPATPDAAKAVLASLMAGELTLNPPMSAQLAGQGLRDVTRIAASDSQLWFGILRANAAALHPVLTSLYRRLESFIEALDGKAEVSEIFDFLDQGRTGRQLIPGKHGGKRQYVVLPVLIDDTPGQLKRLFNDAGDANINIEDVSMEHSPGQPTGVVQISVAPESADELLAYLHGRGWRIYPPHKPANLP
ncbi:prephenate dehydrogenase [mine drainage metagenome]|uniref:Prephenate dehydrogenase n=1 Tax=mine drainage metagenome TaxID=410659 RepID=A0A1J5PX14_9ZZZZ